MTNRQKWFVLVCFLFGLTIIPLIGQLNQSGGPGSTVTANQGGTWTVQPGNTANTTAWKVDGSAVTQPISGNVGQSGTWTVQPGNTANTTAWKVDGSAVTQPVSGTVSVNALPAGSNLIGSVYEVPKTACANTVASQALAAVPTSATAVFASTTCLMKAVFNNTTGSAVTITLSDNAGTPINALLTFSIPASSQLIEDLGGVAFTSGVKWTASASGVTGAMLGYQ
jgi:hypothetical protein